jgi:hypothetical protein
MRKTSKNIEEIKEILKEHKEEVSRKYRFSTPWILIYPLAVLPR